MAMRSVAAHSARSESALLTKRFLGPWVKVAKARPPLPRRWAGCPQGAKAPKRILQRCARLPPSLSQDALDQADGQLLPPVLDDTSNDSRLKLLHQERLDIAGFLSLRS